MIVSYLGQGLNDKEQFDDDESLILDENVVAEDTNTATTITVDLFDADPSTGNKFNLFKTQAVAGNETLQLLTEPLIMLENEVLQVTAADANTLHVVASILEINREDR